MEPFQPRHIAFPSRFFGKSSPVKRSFQANWFNNFPWLHYDLARDAVRCFTCCKPVKDGRAVATGVTEQTYLVKGFTNWKDSIRSFSKHELPQGLCCCSFFYCGCRRHAVTTSCTQKRANREYLLIKFCQLYDFLLSKGLLCEETAMK